MQRTGSKTSRLLTHKMNKADLQFCWSAFLLLIVDYTLSESTRYVTFGEKFTYRANNTNTAGKLGKYPAADKY
tara:strand:+ start:311 stop:529 length:219 start_codon:yes stop_codon:yes gene_type:complete